MLCPVLLFPLLLCSALSCPFLYFSILPCTCSSALTSCLNIAIGTALSSHALVCPLLPCNALSCTALFLSVLHTLSCTALSCPSLLSTDLAWYGMLQKISILVLSCSGRVLFWSCLVLSCFVMSWCGLAWCGQVLHWFGMVWSCLAFRIKGERQRRAEQALLR